MTWHLKGTYVAACPCQMVCPCNVDGRPTTETGECDATMVFHVRDGALDDVDLSGVNIGLFLYLPSNFTAGNVRAGVVIDESASEEQAKAVERIVTGQEGGQFADFSPFISEFAQTTRAKVSFTGGESPSGAIGSAASIAMEPLRGPTGERTKVVDAMFAFGPEYFFGKGSGKVTSPFGGKPTIAYAESGDIDFSG